MRLSFGLASLTLSVLFAAHSLGFIPDVQKFELEGRKTLSESVAVQACLACQHDDAASMQAIVANVVTRHDNVVSAAVRREDGKVIALAGDHNTHWKPEDTSRSTPTHVHVPIHKGKKLWGQVEIRFSELAGQTWLGWLLGPTSRLIIFCACAGFLSYTWYLKRMLQHLDPSSVIPDRVRATLDTLAEGVLVLDKDERIVLANKAFAHNTGCTAEELQGLRAPEIQWRLAGETQDQPEYPWARAIREGVCQTGALVHMDSVGEGERTFVVNSMPILGGDGRRRGALATFDDVTVLEQKNVQLEEMLGALKLSRDEIGRQNEELKQLAMRDPLTGCLNRRAFYTQFEALWSLAQARQLPLSCIMVDIDHFKSVNDTHGHSAGDQVLRDVAARLKATAREGDCVCRYGGEEFCFLLGETDLAGALVMAERVRQAILSEPCAGLKVTASLGVSALELGPREPRELLDQADKALYVSKRSGRNRATSFKDIPPDTKLDAPQPRTEAKATAEVDVAIPFHAVTALMSALSYRDALTAEHSRRVADLCVLTARDLMSQRDCYIMEVAALLHDIGKLGVPDAILLKPGSLTEEEWTIMSAHDRIGVEIIMAAFSSPELSEIVRTHHAWYGGNPRSPELPVGEDIPQRARILTIADAYDAMVSDRVYRKGRSREEAFAELKRCAGKQFDPKLVARFIEAISANDQSRARPALAVSKQSALRIGMQIERLADALDSKDMASLTAMAGHLSATALKEGVPQIADLAGQLQQLARSQPDLMEMVKLTTDLLELCRSTQVSYLAAPEECLLGDMQQRAREAMQTRQPAKV